MDAAESATVLQRTAQEFLDRWDPLAMVKVDWTGDAYLVQVVRGCRMAPAIWLPPPRKDDLEYEIELRRLLVAAAWHLASGRDADAPDV